MKKLFVIIITVGAIIVFIFLAGMIWITITQRLLEKGLVVDTAVDKGGKQAAILAGTAEEVARGKKMYEDMDKLVDPADDYVLNAYTYYDRGDFEKAEQECLKALQFGKHSIVLRSAHGTLLDIYEKTNKYDLAVEEIDWLLDNVNEYAKPELLERKEKLQKLLLDTQEMGQEGTKMDYLKVEFYKILDIDKSIQYKLDYLSQNSPAYKTGRQRSDNPYEKYVGYAEYKNGKVTINVTDPNLEKALKSPFTSMKGSYDKGVVTDEFVTLQPGTLEHLRVIRHELQGYSAVTSDKETNN